MNDYWQTPKALYDTLNQDFHFDFDPCPSDPSFDGLLVEWGESNFVNPPYSQTGKWCEKALAESRKGKKVVMLLRLDASTRWFRDVVLPHAEVRLFYDRVWFVNPKTGKQTRSDHASILAIFNGGSERLNLRVISINGAYGKTRRA